jgi:response regulator of citrate/malate metabolism
MSAGEVAGRTGLARVTVRRYLEYLAATQQASVHSVPHGPGRPQKRYQAIYG